MTPDLETIARRAMQEKGLIVDFPAAALRQAKDCRDLGSVIGKIRSAWPTCATCPGHPSTMTIRWTWTSWKSYSWRIMNTGCWWPWPMWKFSSPLVLPIDAAAKVNTTSVYTGVKNFPMLPERLSFDLTSLLAGKDRRAMVVEIRISADGRIEGSRIFPALVREQGQALL